MLIDPDRFVFDNICEHSISASYNSSIGISISRSRKKGYKYNSYSKSKNTFFIHKTRPEFDLLSKRISTDTIDALEGHTHLKNILSRL